ncbi:AbrB/MazE/SpoVT family DNA-binding domain-containing protein [Pseudonocardia acaciae]|uniref:AbrB/MazE/SpoVT family DNA-binding domain-containing protein n=1 Tax=Pseudonocardia acaciae TaxID=551276 RepID=UPI00049203E5|nr:AbrB/MazE/SpoVT family DNA-binding domain-containing protein [Pseudonocardia acaciae]
MTSRVGPKGQVVIPQQLRHELGIEPGSEVEFWRDGDHVAVRPVTARKSLRGRFKGSPLLGDLMRERVEERDREDRRCR